MYDLDNEIWFGRGSSLGKFQEKSGLIIDADVYLTTQWRINPELVDPIY